MSDSASGAGEGARPHVLLRLLRTILEPYGRAEIETGVVIVVCCVCLGVLQYFGKPYYYVPRPPPPEMTEVVRERAISLVRADPEEFRWVTTSLNRVYHRLLPESYLWWGGACVIFYGIIPLLTALLLTRGKLSEVGYLGLSFRGTLRHSWIYALLFALVAPFVIGVSFHEDFRRTYPFCLHTHQSLQALLVFELGYLMQFLMLEFFFRGFMLFMLAKHIGRHAIFVMVVPYFMIHFGKPFPETLGAIVAGIVLGELALRLRSIWGGVAIHCAVALLMDSLSLWHAGSLARLFGGE